MKFIHVYNPQYFEGLEKNGFLNADSGFKIQHVFSLTEDMKFNQLAAKGSRLHSLIREGNYPFYVDRLTGGVTYHKYDFDKDLIREYRELLGPWFLGIQLHESASNRWHDWRMVRDAMDGSHGPYDAALLRQRTISDYARTPAGELLPNYIQDPPEIYAERRYPETLTDYRLDVEDMFRRRMAETDGCILPCDSFYLMTHMQQRMGMHTFMPEVGCQIPHMRMAVALARGMAGYDGKLWGTYYETWRGSMEEGYSMPCYNTDPGNEWHLSQEQHPDDFTSFGPNGGSSRLLQNRIYYYSLMSGADYMAEEWGLNCSYTDMRTFELSEYGLVKKRFIDDTQILRGIKAKIPFAVVLPVEYICVQIPGAKDPFAPGVWKDEYMGVPVTEAERRVVGQAEDVLKHLFRRDPEKIFGNEGHVLTNSAFGDLFDIIYEDAPEAVLRKYDHLIDATPEGRFASSHGEAYSVLPGADREMLTRQIRALSEKLLPCTADNLHWLLSEDETGRRYVTVFNNEGNRRSSQNGDNLIREADAFAVLTFCTPAKPEIFRTGGEGVTLQRVDAQRWRLQVPAAGFAILRY